MPNIDTTHYQPDILGSDYEQYTISLPDDEEGPVVATLVRKKASIETNKAVLYIHGFIDYFFQTEMAEQFNHHGYDFYALDLRKYGRSLRSYQKAFFVKDLKVYDQEIQTALEIIAAENHDHVLLAGHSTGGLTTTLFAHRHPDHPLIKALWVNSPFYDFNMNTLKKKYALPQISKLGKKYPKLRFPSELNPYYVQSIHRKYHGEWNFDLNLKPEHYPKIYLSFVHAIFEAQKTIHRGASLSIPVLVMHAARTTSPKKFNADVQTSDVILDVKTIEKYANKLQGDVSVITIHDGIHDLVLSRPTVRANVYVELFQWLNLKQIDQNPEN